MALPALLTGHNHISERESDGTWEDCTWDAGLEWYRLTYDPSKPATHAEAQALRKASGEPTTGGSNQGDFRRGVKARYGVTLVPAISGFADLWAALTPGKAASAQGSMSVFGSAHRLSRWQPGFNGGHDVFVARVDATNRVWWCDPLATDSGYLGEFVTKAELSAYVTALGGQHLVQTLLTARGDAVANLTTYLPGYTAVVKAASNIRSEPRIAATRLHGPLAGAMAVNLVGTVKGDVDPANGSDVWYEFFHDGRSEYTAKDNVVDIAAPVPPVPPPDTTPFSQADLDAARDAGAAAGRVEGAEAEKERIAQAEANRIRTI